VNQPETGIEPIEVIDYMFSRLRHKLGNTVNSIQITLEVLISNLDSFDDAKRLDFLEMALGQAKSQYDLLEAMKSFSRSNAEENRPIQFALFWNSLLVSLQERFAESKVPFEHEAEPGNYHFMGDQIALTRVLGHLLDNALDATEDLDDPLIKLKTTLENGTIKMAIIDNGAGIPPEYYRKLYFPFFSTKKGRMGLGLPMALKMIDQMGGRIKIDNNDSSGVTAAVILKQSPTE
jgi:C4-dicarboxylate-specific signal transduction histidine kinase